MYKYHCLNPVSDVGLEQFTEEYVPVSTMENADAVLVRSAVMHDMEFTPDLKVIARAGADKLVGGIGDTIAKWYESAPVFDQASDLTVFDRLAYHSAHLIHDMLLEESEPALEAVRAGDYDNEHVRTLINTIIGLAGTGVALC